VDVAVGRGAVVVPFAFRTTEAIVARATRTCQPVLA
jgi:hypothetical protein